MKKKSSEARERVCSAPNWVSLRKLQHHKYINFQKQHPWSSKQRFYIRALIWHFKILGFNKTLINHVQRDYSTGVYLGKAIQYREVTYLVLLIRFFRLIALGEYFWFVNVGSNHLKYYSCNIIHPTSPRKYVLIYFLFRHWIILEGSHYFYILLLMVWVFNQR